MLVLPADTAKHCRLRCASIGKSASCTIDSAQHTCTTPQLWWQPRAAHPHTCQDMRLLLTRQRASKHLLVGALRQLYQPPAVRRHMKQLPHWHRLVCCCWRQIRLMRALTSHMQYNICLANQCKVNSHRTHLGTRWCRILHHGLQQVRGNDDRLARLPAAHYHLLLD